MMTLTAHRRKGATLMGQSVAVLLYCIFKQSESEIIVQLRFLGVSIKWRHRTETILQPT